MASATGINRGAINLRFPRLLALLFLALGGRLLAAADEGPFLDLVVKQARAGDHEALKWETYGRKFSPELTDIECGELIMLFSGYRVTHRTVTPFAAWKPAVNYLSFNGKSLAYAEPPDAVAQFEIRSEKAAAKPEDDSTGTVVIPIVFREGKFWMVAMRYK
jgi:hypothetical protein